MYNKTLSVLSGETDNRKIPDPFGYIKRYGKECKRVTRSPCYTEFDIRNLLCNEKTNCRTPWINDIPYALREGAIKEAHKNLLTNQKKVNEGKIKFFNMKFRSKKDKTWCLKNIRKEGVSIHDKQISVLPSYLGRIKTTEQIKEIEKDVSIHYDGKNFFLCVPIKVKENKVNQNNWFCSLDPGSRKFQTLYSPDGDNCIGIGDRASSVIYKLLLVLDKTKNPQKQFKLRNRIQNLQKELHCKTALFLCQNYKNIYIPKLTKNNDIISKRNRKIGKKTVRQMVLLGHCKFIKRLKNKANEYNVNVNIITEEYTSQVCHICGLKTKTGKEIFKCRHCSSTIDRDILGSRNILLKQWGLMDSMAR